MEVKDTLIKLSGDIIECHKDIAELGILCSRACKEIYIFSRKRYRLLAAVGIVYILIAESKRKDQDKMIETLTKEVEELKEMKGD